MKVFGMSVILACVLAIAGCATYIDEETPQLNEAERERLELERMKVDVSRLLERVEAIEQAQQDIYSQFEALRSARENEGQTVRDQLAATERTLKANDEAMARLRQEIIDNVARKVADIVNARPAAPAQPAKREAGSREHVVQPGETLSAIAAAYKVKSSAIIQANGLKNADSLRAGQKLLIPE